MSGGGATSDWGRDSEFRSDNLKTGGEFSGSGGTSDPEQFARDLVDNLRIAETVRERDDADTGERLSLDELIRSQGFDAEDFDAKGEA